MTVPANPEQLICAGEFYTDLIFFDLERLPSLGQEVKTDDFAVSLGGGAAITATAAARMGRSAHLVTVWGASMLEAEARRRLDEAGVSCAWSQRRPEAMSGVTVAVSTRQDRCFLTHPGANRFVEEYLLGAEAQERFGLAGHVHFALTPTRWGAFAHAIQRLQSRGTTVSWDLGWDPAAMDGRQGSGICADGWMSCSSMRWKRASMPESRRLERRSRVFLIHATPW